MEIETAVNILGATSVVIAAFVTSFIGRIGWRQSVERDLAIFEKLYPLANDLDDDVVLEGLRIGIFRRMNKVVFKPFYGTALTYCGAFIVGMVITIFIKACFGIELSPLQMALDASACLTGVIIAAVSTKLLGKFPKTKKNPFYARRLRSQEEGALVRKARSILEEANIKSGWYGNYYAYTQWRRNQWGWESHYRNEVINRKTSESGRSDEN